ncbi:MAG TPA: glycine/sarcosine/betaine reductase component B subunit [Candidatus Binatia bacterium]|jgi:glycine reductase|nr:glycine/sarcosine/betaine reductase component B subunit [Candidatus Binatia bacterium]
MELELFDYSIDELRWGERTALTGKSLSVHAPDLRELLKDLSHGIHVDYEIARPGESKRVVHVLDTVLPIAKLSGHATTFPGFDGPAQLVGTGKTIRIRNLLVTVAGRFPNVEALTPIEKPREGILDMGGVGAPFSYGSDRFHLILSLTPDSSVSNTAFDQSLRNMALRCARYLAQVEKTNIEPEKQVISLKPVSEHLPRVVLIYQVQSQLCCARTFYYAEEVSKTLPTFVHPAEFFDGAVVSGNYKSERKIPTSQHCANPFIAELLERHGKTINFLGVILSRGYNDSFEQKKKMGLWAARLARNLGAEGAVAIMEGTGNGTVDFMQTVKACEDEGIKTVAVLHESNGPKGYERPLVDHPKEADGMISRGNVSERIYIPPLTTVIGGSEIDLHLKASQDPRLPFLFDPTIFFGSYGKMGSSGFRAEYEN